MSALRNLRIAAVLACAISIPVELLAQERILDSKRLSSEVSISPATTLDQENRLISVFYRAANEVVIWVDDGLGGATAKDRLMSDSEFRVIDSGNAISGTAAVAVNGDNQVVASYNIDAGGLKVWIDDGAGGGVAGDLIATAGEIRIVDADGINPSITFDANGHLAISYYDNNSSDLNLWVDDGLGGGTAGDGAVTGGEIRTIDSAGDVGNFSSIILDANDHLAIVYLDATNIALKLWVDDGTAAGTPGNGEADGGEVRVIDSDVAVGNYSAISLNSSNRLMVSYYDADNTLLKLWVDDGLTGGTAGDAIVNGAERRTITTVAGVDGNSVGLNEGNRVAIAYATSGAGDDLYLWIDDGKGGGTAGDLVVNGAEIRTITDDTNVDYSPTVIRTQDGDLIVTYYDGFLSIYAAEGYTAQTLISTGDVGDSPSIAYGTNQHLAISYIDQTNSAVMLWYDNGAGGGTAGDRIATAGEIRTIDSGSTYVATRLVREPNGTTFALSYIDEDDSAVYVWVDDGAGGGVADDAIATAGEIRTVASGAVGNNLSMTFNSDDRLAIAYTRNSDLMLWVDDGAGGGNAGDYIVDAGEIRTIDGANLGHYAALADINGKLALVYLDDNRTNALLWYDNGAGGGVDDDGQATAGEIQTVETNLISAHQTAIGSIDGYLAVGYVRPGTGLKLWIDDGNGGGNPSDAIVDAGEIRVVESSADPSTSALAITTDSLGRAAVAYSYGSTPKLWLDDGTGVGSTEGNRLATAGEIRTLATGLFFGSGTRNVVSVVKGDAPDGRLVIAGKGVAGSASNDLILFSLTPVAPEINITGNGTNIVSGDSTPSGPDHTDFESTNVTGGTVVRTFTIQNTGNDNLILSGTPRVALSGADAASFSVTAQPATPIAAAGSQTFDVTFDPSSAGVKNATVSIDNNDPDENPYTFAIRGTGVAPEIAVSGNNTNIVSGDVTPSSADHTDFGSTNVTDGIVNRTFTIENSGGADLILSGTPRVELSGGDAAQFSVTTQPSSPVEDSDSTTFVVRYDPSATGSHSTTVSIANNDSDENPFTFAISGTGVVPEINVRGNNVDISSGDATPTSGDHTNFGSVDTATGSQSRTFTIQNTGTGSLTLSGTPKVALSGGGAAEFSVTTQPTSPVAAAGSTTFTILFNPTSDGVKTATVSIANDDSNENPYTFAIQGTGTTTNDDDDDNNNPTDSDGDGVSDEQEAIDGTNPNDAGSALEILPTSWCSEWNGFFGMYNVNEYANKDTNSHSISTTFYNIDGTQVGDGTYSLAAATQFDVLVHDLVGWTISSYGQVCTAVGNAAEAGDIDGRAVFYKPDNNGGFDFAYSTPFSAGITGKQFVTFNNYQPSANQADGQNDLANWLQLVNSNETAQSGLIRYYREDGSLLGSEGITLEPRGRRDFSAHRFGRNISGLVEWTPYNSSAKFTFRNVRYYYNNPQGLNSFDSAFQIEARRGNGELMGVVLDARNQTAILEVANVTNSAITVAIKFYNSSGALRLNQVITLPAHGSRHIIADSILANGLGSVTLKGSSAGSVIAAGMHYKRRSDQGIETIYGVSAKQAIGNTFWGSYNTYLGQGCELLITNTSTSSVTATVSMRRLDSTQVVAGDALTIPANGTQRYNACGKDLANQYGTVKVVANSGGKILPVLIRVGENGDYRFPVEMR